MKKIIKQGRFKGQQFERMEIPIEIKSLMKRLLDAGYPPYIIGGAVRDWRLGIEPHDYDIFSKATGKQILKVFPKGKVIGSEERQKKILTVVVENTEISQFRKSGDRTQTGNSLEEHQATCDFYMNAIAVDINGEMVNNNISQQGIKDISKGYVNFVGDADERIEEDPLRLLRFIKFLAKYKFDSTDGYHVLKNTIEWSVAPERIRDEWIKIMQYDNGLKLLHEYGFLKEIVPELYHKNHFEYGGEYHAETPFEHMMLSFKQACKITTDYRIKIAATLHDIGKGDTREEDGPGNIHFYSHQKIGAEIVKKILKRLVFTNADIDFISSLVRWHMFGYMTEILDKTYVKFYAGLKSKGISIYDFLMVVYCDRQANLKKQNFLFGDFCKSSNEKWLLYHYNRIKSKAIPFSIKGLAISGKDLIEGVGLKPGPVIGQTLKKIYDLVLEGELKNSREELMHYIKKEGKMDCENDRNGFCECYEKPVRELDCNEDCDGHTVG